jgi:hypothetical protein
LPSSLSSPASVDFARLISGSISCNLPIGLQPGIHLIGLPL